MKTTMKRIFSLLIVLVMVCGMLPVVASAADGTWTMVTDASTLAVDDQIIIVAKDADYALSTTQNSNNRGQAGVTKSGNTLTFTSGVQVLTLEEGTVDGTFAFNTGSGYLYAASSSKNYLKTQTTNNANGSWLITIDANGVATIKAQGANTRNWLRYNSSNTPPLFSCYGSGQDDVAIYKLVVAGGEEDHEHTYTEEITAATCTEDGVKTFACSCGDSYTEVIPATGHNYVDGVCTICHEEQYSISFSVNGTVSETIPYVSGGITMPTGNDSGSYTFAGWTDAAITTEGTVAPGTVYAAGQVVEFDAETTLHALYTRTEGSTATEYVETALTDIGIADQFVIVGTTSANESYAMANDKGTSAAPTAVTITVANGKLTATPANNILWTLSKSGNSYTFHPNGDTSKWLYCTNTNNGVRVGTTDAKTFTLDTSGYLKHDGTARYVGVYVTNPDWRCYADTNGNIANQTFKFYAKPTATIFYTTTIGCNHVYEGEVTTAATCTTDGLKTYTCSACGDSYTEAIPAIGHSYGEGIVTAEPSCTATGVMTYTCSECNETTTEEIPAVGHSWVGGTCSVCGEKTDYYTLVTDASALKAGDKIIIVAIDYEFALSTNQGENNRAQAAVTKGADGIAPGSDVQIITLEAGTVDGTLAFNVGDGYLYAVSTSSNHLRTQAAIDDNASWLITIDAEGVATIKAQGTNTRNWLRYNNSSSLFSCYGETSTQKDVAIYKLAVTGGEEEDHEHTYTEEITVPATCTTDGEKTFTCSVCNLSYKEVIPATGHNYVDGQCTACGYYEPDSLLTIPEAVAFGESYAHKTYSPDKFYVEGFVDEVYNTIYGNMYIKDAQGEVFTIYGTYSADGSVRYDAMDVKPVAGDYVKIYGNIGQFNGVAQIQNGWLAAHCTHKDAEGNSLYTGVETTAPGCETEGVMTYTCQCGHSYTEVISATGHNYVLGEDGVTYTCSNCGDSYSAFTVSFSVPEGITPVADMIYTNGIVLPAVESSGDYIFIGWTDVQLAAADKVETAPTIYPANETFYTNEACTLYALYAYDTVGGFSGYELADSTDCLYVGAQIIIVGAEPKEDVFYAMSTNQKTNNRGAAAVTKDGDRIAELSDDVQVLTLQKDADTGYWALYTGAGYLFAAGNASSKQNYLRTQEENDANGLWEITFNGDKIASIIAQGTNIVKTMQYNITDTSNLFSCYTGASQTDLNIFVKQDGTVTYYSTDLGCEHEYVGVETTPAGCETEGVMTYTCSKCGESYTEVIEAIGHAWDEGTVTTAPTCATAGVMTYTCANNGCTKEEAIARLAHDFTNGDCVCGHPAPDSVLTIAEANQWGLAYDKDVYSSGKYYIEGTIESIKDTKYGNMYIQDADGNKFYIYGLYSEDGSVRFDAMDPQPAVGDTIKIYTVIGTHNGTEAQAKNAWLVVDYVNSYNVELTDKIGMNFKLTANVTSATVTFGGETTTVDLTSLPTDENGLRIYNLKMAAVQMTEEVTWLFNGKTEVSYSVRGYADEVLAGEYGANVKAMVQAMLHYGAAAQDYFDYNEGNFANLNMQDTVTNPIQAAEMVPTTGSTAGIVHYGSTLVYRDRVAVRVYFKLTGDAAIGDYTFTANGENAEVNEGSNGLYYVEIADIVPQNLDEAVTVVVNDGLTVTYSPLNYIYRMSNKTDDAVLQNLLQQLYDYYLAADYLAANGADDFETEPDVVG